MIFNVSWIPEFYYLENKIKNPFNLNKSLEFVQEKINDHELFESCENVFWTLLLLYQLDKFNYINKEKVAEYILDLKNQEGGYRSSVQEIHSDIWSTFYCIASLKLLDLGELVEDKDLEFIISSQNLNAGGDGGFTHCRSKDCAVNCNGKTSMKSTLFALSTLLLLNKLNKIDRKIIYKFLNKNPDDEAETIFKILSLKLLNKNILFKVEKKSSIISIWTIPESGIDKKFPSIHFTFWTIITLGLIKKLDLIDFGRMLDFLKNMQQENGGFTEQYTGISLQQPNLHCTALGLICIYYVWDKLINLIENEILVKASKVSNIYISPISNKFSVSSKLIINIADWLISNKLISGKIYNIKNKFQDYYEEQNQTAQEIITLILKEIQSHPTEKKIDLNEFSKKFNFSNALEKIKLVINDLIIKEFLLGNITALKKKYTLEEFLILEDYIQISQPVSLNAILREKRRIKHVKYKLITFNIRFNQLLENAIEYIGRLIEEEKTSEARSKLNQIHSYFQIIIKRVENSIIKIKSEHKFVFSELLFSKYDKDWPIIMNSIEGQLSTFLSNLEQKIKEKEKFIKERTEESEDKDVLTKLEDYCSQKSEQVNSNQEEMQKFFSKDFINHDEIIKKINISLKFIEETDSLIKTEISSSKSLLHFEKFYKPIENLNIKWINLKEKLEANLNTYSKIIEARTQLINFIKENTTELQTFSEKNNKEILNLINENKLERVVNLINESVKNFNQLVSKQYESFNQIISEINNEIKEFPDYSNDIISEFNKKLKNEENAWNEILKNLNKNLHSELEIESKEELDAMLKKNVADIEKAEEETKQMVLELIGLKKLEAAKSKIDDLYSDITKRIKSCDDDFQNYIKAKSTEFKTFPETVSNLNEYWMKKEENLAQNLNQTKIELQTKLDKAESEAKTQELRELIKTQSSNFDDKLTQLELKYNLILKSKKNLEENESNFRNEHLQIQTSLKSFDSQIKNFIKTNAKTYNYFNQMSPTEEEFWNNQRLSLEKKIQSLFIKISDNFFINNVQFIVGAFKGKKIELSYLSKVMKYKPKELKLKLISLISNSKFNGELDSSTDTFTLTDGVVYEGVPLKEIESTVKDSEPDEEDIIKQDILKMRYLMVIHYRVGASVYSRQLGHWKMDSDMIGGFLTAMQDFSAEIKKKKIPMKRMEYKEFEILIEQGKYVFSALFIDGKETDWMRERLKSYVNKFEKYFESNLKQWRGELRSFSSSGFLVDEAFELYRV